MLYISHYSSVGWAQFLYAPWNLMLEAVDNWLEAANFRMALHSTGHMSGSWLWLVFRCQLQWKAIPYKLTLSSHMVISGHKVSNIIKSPIVKMLFSSLQAHLLIAKSEDGNQLSRVGLEDAWTFEASTVTINTNICKGLFNQPFPRLHLVVSCLPCTFFASSSFPNFFPPQLTHSFNTHFWISLPDLVLILIIKYVFLSLRKYLKVWPAHDPPCPPHCSLVNCP